MSTVVAVTGGEGFVGQRVVDSLARTPGVEAIRIVRPGSDPKPKVGCRIVTADVLDDSAGHPLGDIHADVLVHLAWSGLNDFRSNEHQEQVAAHARFLASSIEAGVQRVVCAGTCLEYGLTEGEIDEERPAQPTVAYAKAKNELHKEVIELTKRTETSLLWARIFYPFGPGQHPKSLWASLQDAIDRADPTFPMSLGMQVRDYLPVEDVGAILAQLACAEADGILNVCSGEPVVLRQMVEGWIRDRGSDIKLDPGVYGYPDYEPMEFWGSRRRLDAALAAAQKGD